MRYSLAVFLLLTLSACSLFGPSPDKDAPKEQVTAEAQYKEAKAELDVGAFESSIKLYEALLTRFPYGRYAQQSQLEMAYAYYRQGEDESAVATLERFIKQYPNNPHVDYAYYLKGLATFDGEISFFGALDGQDPTERDPRAAQASFDAFKDLVARFPDSKYAPDARVRMFYLLNTLAKHELNIARYYLRRGANIAAVNRAQGIVAQYPNSPSTRQALQVMAQAYDALGMTDLRDDTTRILEKNQLDADKVAAIAAEKSGKSWWQFWK